MKCNITKHTLITNNIPHHVLSKLSKQLSRKCKQIDSYNLQYRIKLRESICISLHKHHLDHIPCIVDHELGLPNYKGKKRKKNIYKKEKRKVHRSLEGFNGVLFSCMHVSSGGWVGGL